MAFLEETPVTERGSGPHVGCIKCQLQVVMCLSECVQDVQLTQFLLNSKLPLKHRVITITVGF